MRILSVCIVVLCSACGGGPKPVSYSDKAKESYVLGVEALDDKNYIDAIENFSTVKTKYPYSQYAALAEVKIADAYFKQDKFVEAISAYRTFAQRRPNHAEVPYVMFMIGEGYYEQQPSKFFLFPPSFEKDKGATHDAVRSYRSYLDRFPKHGKNEVAKKKMAECRSELADFELYVARYYLSKERPVSALGRLEFLHRTFEDVSTQWALASLMLIDTYLVLGRPDKHGEVQVQDAKAKAQKVAERIVTVAPDSNSVRQAKKYLRLVGAGQPAQGRPPATQSPPVSKPN